MNIPSVSSKAQLLERLLDYQSDLRAFGVKRLAVFGSFVRDASRPESDVDLLLEFQPGMKSFDRFMKISLLLEEVLQRRVELVTTEALSPYLGPRILSEAEDVLLAASRRGLPYPSPQ